MKLAVIGAGISGLTAAYVLSRRHQVTLFEANDYCGGHAHTAVVNHGQRSIPIDTGFIVFNGPNYPNLCHLFEQLDVPSIDSDMSFSVRCERSGIEYNGSSLGQLFGQRRNLLKLEHWSMLRDILRFHREARDLLTKNAQSDETVDQYARRRRFGAGFLERYLVPLGASLWSCPARTFRSFPMRFVVDFLHNHAMLQVKNRPQWRTVSGGSKTYVNAMLNAFFDVKVRMNTPVTRLKRVGSGVEIFTAGGNREEFDEAILATHADVTANLLGDGDEREREILSAFPYQENKIVLHTDTAVLPKLARNWASWNYLIPQRESAAVSVSYNMNKLQKLECNGTTYCVSLNPAFAIAREAIRGHYYYDHPVYTQAGFEAQKDHEQFIRRRGVSLCGAYWGHGFHEDGVSSALRVTQAYGMGLAA